MLTTPPKGPFLCRALIFPQLPKCHSCSIHHELWVFLSEGSQGQGNIHLTNGGEFFIPCGSTVHWYRLASSELLTARTVMANIGESSVCRGMLKKQSFRSTSRHCQESGAMDGKGNPGCKGPISCKTALTPRKSCSSHH